MKYQIMQTDVIQCAPDWEWYSDKNGWTGYLLWNVLGGSAHIRKGEDSFLLSPGDCFLFDLSWNHICTHQPATPLYVETVYLHSEKPLSAVNFHICGNHALNAAIHRCVTLHRHEDYENAEIWVAAAISEFVNSYGESMTPEEEQAEQWCTWIEEKINRPFCLDEFCVKAGYSKNQLIRIFKKHTGKTPYHYYIQCKIRKSVSFLLYTNYTVSEIAALMGFCDVAHFSKCFKSVTGYSPAEIRKVNWDTELLQK